MNNYQNAQVNMLDSVKLFFTENAAIVSTFTPLEDQVTLFNNNHTNLKQVIQRQIAPITGVTTDKDEEAEKLIEMILTKARLAHAWAMTNELNELAVIFNVSETSLERLTENELIATTQTIVDKLLLNATDLAPYGITPIIITAIQDQITLFSNLVGSPEVAIGGRETATKIIPILIKETIDILKITDDLVYGNFADSNPGFVSDYVNVRQINNTGIRHTGIRATILITGSETPIQNATLLLQELNRTATSNIAGLAEIIKFKAGTYHFITTHPAYQPLTQILKITRGKILDINIELTPL